MRQVGVAYLSIFIDNLQCRIILNKILDEWICVGRIVGGDKDHKILSFFGVEEFIFGCGGCMITLSNLNICYWVVLFEWGKRLRSIYFCHLV